MISSGARLVDIGLPGNPEILNPTRVRPVADVLPRVLAFGSRDWTDSEKIGKDIYELRSFIGDFILVHGGCPTGADRMADRYARDTRLPEPEVHFADWSRWGKAAGPIRNQEMADIRPDYAVGWILNSSSGASDMYGRLDGVPSKVTWMFSAYQNDYPGMPRIKYPKN